TFGPGFKAKVMEALLTLDDPQILEIFATTKFIPTRDENYQTILQVGKEVGIIKQ
ncbi:MAG: phosphonate transporter substrate-binding protein, partial [Dehalococcoidia bacterium]|nr:phosphonate transporter substrate-binding protein [Dehalococcoidia bacterium]